MANKVKRVSSTEAELTIDLAWAKIEENYEEELQKILKKAVLPGFRQGKAPRNVLEKKLGDSFLQEIAADSMDKALKDAVEEIEEKLRPLPYAATTLQDEEKVFPVKKNEDITFTVKYEVMPEFEVKKYKGYSVEYPNVKISDDMVNTEIEHLREQNSMLQDKKDAPIEMGDVVNVDYEAIGVADSKRNAYTFTVGSHSSYFEFDEDIVGMKKGDEKEIVKTYKNDDEKPYGFEGDSATIKVKINSVKKKDIPALDDEFAQDVNEKYKTVKDLKDGIRKKLEDRLNDSLKETKLSLLLEKISPDVNLQVPKCMIDFEVASAFRRFASQMGMSEADAVKFLGANGQSLDDFTSPWRNDAKKTIESQLIITRVRDTEKLTASEEEINKKLDEQFKGEENAANKDMYKDMVKDNLEYEMAVELLLKENKFTPSKKEISYEDFASGAYLEEEKKEAGDDKDEKSKKTKAKKEESEDK